MDPAAVFATLSALGGTAPPTIVIGCEVETVEEGMGLSEPVTAAVPAAVAAIHDVLADLFARTTATAEG